MLSLAFRSDPEGVSWNSHARSSPEPKAMLRAHSFKNNYDKCQTVESIMNSPISIM